MELFMDELKAECPWINSPLGANCLNELHEDGTLYLRSPNGHILIEYYPWPSISARTNCLNEFSVMTSFLRKIHAKSKCCIEPTSFSINTKRMSLNMSYISVSCPALRTNYWNERVVPGQILWHDARKPEWRNQRRRPSLGNDSVNSFPRKRIRSNNRITSVVMQRRCKHALSTVETLYFLRGPCRGVIKRTKKIIRVSPVSRRQPARIWALELELSRVQEMAVAAENWESRQSKVIEEKLQESN
jgi:hypothetical protein